MPCRKNFTALSPVELDRLADALNQLYADGLITDFANLHNDSWPNIHWEPQFLPWHRHFILRLEQALRGFDDRVMLPFWDWTRVDSRDLNSGVWSTFFGGRSNTGGRFDHWNITRLPSDNGTLPTIVTVSGVLDEGSFTDFRDAVEPGSVHTAGHTWVGEDMASGHSPRDPLFYLHHCNVDRIWAIWQMNNPGLTQYDTTPVFSDGNSGGAPVALNDVMIGGATPASMLNHQSLNILYPLDAALEAERPGTISGDPVGVSLVTNTVWFNDIPEDEETRRPATFKVEGCEGLNFEVTAGPTAPFELHDGGFVAHPQTDLHTDEVRIWIRYRGTTAGAMDTGVMTVRVTDNDGNLVQEFPDIDLQANTVVRPRSAVVMVLDESGSMLYDAGNNRTRLEVLQRAARTFVDNLYDDTGLALVSFDETATKLTDLADAGGMTSAVRIAARQAITNHGPPNNQPHTSIGAGIERATTLYTDAANTADYETRATLVFTDGVQDREPWISEVSPFVSENIYAIGVANAANVANGVLTELAAGTGGTILVTGAIGQDDEFLLEKFFIQILAGVQNAEIVRDPPGTMALGEIDEVDFQIAQPDIGFDAIVLTSHPGAVLVALRAPDGTLLLPNDFPPGSVRVGSSSVDVRVTLPVVHDGVAHWAGTWQLLMTLGIKHKHGIRDVSTASSVALGQPVLPYHALVHARSNLRLIAAVDQNGSNPGSEFLLSARMNEYGWPMETHPQLSVLVRRPDHSLTTIQLNEDEIGRYTGTFIGDQSGSYLFRVIVTGHTTAGEPFTREHLLTGVLGRPSQPNPADPGDGSGVHKPICELLHCLVEAMSPELRKRLQANGFNPERLEACFCKDKDPLAQLAKQPELLRLFKQLTELK